MVREVACGPEDFDPVVRSERRRGNKGGHWMRQPQLDPQYHFTHPLDLDAVLAEFDLPDCIQVNRFPDGRTSLGCNLTRTTLGGGPRPRGWLGRRQQRQWWEAWKQQPRPRTLFAPRDGA